MLVGDDHRAQAWGTESLKGEQLFTLLDGRFPAAPDEVAVGIATRSTVGQPGADRIQLGAPGGTKSFRVVGHVLFPPSQTEAFADGVLLTRSGIEQLGAAQGATLLGSWAARTDRVVAVARLRAGGAGVVEPRRPPQIDNLDDVTVVLRLLAAFFGLLAATALLHTIAATLRHRGHELAVLRVLGLERVQVRATIVSQTTVLIALSSLLGVPLGIAAGRRVWAQLADGLHVATDPLVPLPAIASIAAPLAAVGLGVALGLAGPITRRRPAQVLRSA